MKNVIGTFKNIDTVNSVLGVLEERGYTKDDISVIATKDTLGTGKVKFKDNTVESVTDTALTGGVLGGILGLLVGLGALTIPGLGLLFVAGPIATALGITGVAGTTLSGALTGSLVGGLAGAFMQMGVDEEMAVEYEKEVKTGNIVLGVETDDDDAADIATTFDKHGASRVTSLNVKAYVA